MTAQGFTGDNSLRLVVDPSAVIAVAEVAEVKGAARIGRSSRAAGCILYMTNGDSFWVAQSFDEARLILSPYERISG